MYGSKGQPKGVKSSQTARKRSKDAQLPQRQRTSPAKSRKQSSNNRATQKPKPAVHTRRAKTTSLAKRRRKKMRWGRLGFVLVIAVGLGYGASWLLMSGLPALYQQIRADIAQVTNQSAPLPYGTRAYDQLSHDLASYIQTQPGNFAVSGADLVTGARFGYNQDTAFSSAQTIALPVAIKLYSDIANGVIRADAVVKLTPADEQAGPGFTGGMPYGTQFTVFELTRAALDKQDVVALNMLIRKLGVDQIDNFMTGTGSNGTLSPPYLVTPRQLELYLSYLYTMNEAHPQAVAPLLRDLGAVPAEGRIKSAFPNGVPVYHVTGDWPREFHDAAIASVGGHPFIIAICSDGVSANAAARTEAHIANLVRKFEKNGL